MPSSGMGVTQSSRREKRCSQKGPRSRTSATPGSVKFKLEIYSDSVCVATTQYFHPPEPVDELDWHSQARFCTDASRTLLSQWKCPILAVSKPRCRSSEWDLASHPAVKKWRNHPKVRKTEVHALEQQSGQPLPYLWIYPKELHQHLRPWVQAFDSLRGYQVTSLNRRHTAFPFGAAQALPESASAASGLGNPCFEVKAIGQLSPDPRDPSPPERRDMSIEELTAAGFTVLHWLDSLGREVVIGVSPRHADLLIHPESWEHRNHGGDASVGIE